MKRILLLGSLALFLSASLAPAGLADSREHRRAIKVCKQKYKDAVRGAKYLKQKQRTERIDQARRQREECEKLAPK
jgi:hypothetical protein